jgi:PAS domain S-box-containing protein
VKATSADNQTAGALEALKAQNSQLRLRLEEAEETLAAIRSGAIDAVVVEQGGVNRIYTVEGADRPYRLFVEEMQQAAATLHRDGTIAWCNRQLGILLKVPQPKLLGAPLRAFVLADDQAAYDHSFVQGRTQSGGAAVQLRRSDGALVPTFLNFNTLPEDCGSAFGVLVNDLTSQRRHEELSATHVALRASEDRLRLAHQVARIGTFEWNIETGVNIWDAELEAMYGLPPGGFAATQAAWEQLVHPEDRPEAIRNVNQALVTGEFEGEWRTVWPDGSIHWLIGRATVLRDESGKPVKLFGVNLDITERKRTEEALRTVQSQLEEHARQLETRVAERTADLQAINTQLEAFVYSIAHDLRAPLRSMQGFSEMLVDLAAPVLNAEGRDLARRISRSAQFMDALLQDLLAFSRVAQQGIRLSPIPLESVVRTVISRLDKEIEEKAARVEVEGPMPAVLAHEPTLGQVVFNLLTNALKFVAPGVGPRVRVRCEELAPRVAGNDGADRSSVRVWVEDNGIGIAPEHQQQIFRLFARLQGNTYSGTGVGLPIVKKGIERMGGRLGVESALGQGSRFWFDLRKA